MAGKSVGTIFAELDLDTTKFTRAQKTILKEAGVVTMGVEKNYKTLGIKSAAIFDAMRAQAENAYQGIKNSARATADDIVRAEKAKAEKIKTINSEQFGDQKSMLESLKAHWMAAAVVIAAVTVAAKKAYDQIAAATLVAARFETLGVAMNVVGKNAGYGAEQMDRFQTGLEKTGISMVGARQALTRMAQAQLDLSRSSELARIAQDTAVIGNINSTEAFNQLVYGIQSANVRVLRTIGINVSFEESYQKVATQLGRTAVSFSEAEKATIRLNAVLDKGKDVAGTYEAAMTTAGKKLLSIERHLENLKTLSGQVFTPTLGEMVDIVTEALKGLNEQLADSDGELKKIVTQSLQPFVDLLRGTVEVVTLMSGGGKRGFWAYFWGENKFEENKRLAEEALKMATSYKDEFAGIDSSGGIPTPGGSDNTPADVAKIGEIDTDIWQTRADEKYEVLSRQYADEEALANEYRETRLAQIIEDHENALAIVEERKKAEIDAMNAIAKGEEWLAQQKRKAEEDKKKLQAQTMKDALDNTKFALKAMGQENAAAFEAFKAISIAETVVNTAKAAMGAFSAMASIPYVGPALGAAAAAAAIAAGAAQIATISRMSAGGGSAGASGFSGGSVGTYSASPTTGIPDSISGDKEQLPTINVNIENYVDSEENRRNLMEWMNDFVEDKGGRLVSSDARFAENLR